MTNTPEMVIVCCAFFVFACGALGVVYRKNPVAVLMSIELMINAAILVLILGSRVHNNAEGQAAGLLVLVLGAAEVVVGLALALAVFRGRNRVDVDAPAEIVG
ncbi:MAG: NADH-quinone oxidoreductase subunit NuoK [Deltaproteobacteria bacterium]|nr:NADH-quinone oxidoreductase subunit NuoK [Deltaproteobacteria bacterium]